ncbi:hypothetical protein E2562_029081 [Oryza meyeriana var. granulata]|uniref:Uncharacterized protein n=1 Tax=Oryza meyeriana var. granulata TaxID=110450 RepID=A0A6G1CUE8_9ORYZ|nr:hypothetical protein E2562_029081 [Oryza meyeriana var. granulata]
MAYSSGGGGKLSAVDAILAEAADLVALEQIAKLNTAHLADDSALPSSLDLKSRFRKLKSLPSAAPPPPAKTLGWSATVPPHRTDPADPPRQNPSPPAAAPPAPAAQERGPEGDEKRQEKENNFPPQAHPPPAAAAAQDGEEDEEDLEKLFRPGRGRPTLRERNRGRDEDSPSPPRQACCFSFSPKKTLQRTPTRSGGRKSHAGVADDDVLGIGDAGEWGDENRRMVNELKQQQRKLKKALEEQVKVSRETAKMARWVKQASARMTHNAAIDDLLSDCDDEDELK